ncbi:hypothetical protein INS49_011979 [Diaporthe citri]|uniref:uncharacterized protein n=1 Tax=Diaporthe citri TaxID=83186 RepID=UPI001C821387|nr:uncharacterized protein INS49_011979 [Diaporthe citri]KAG6360911.1 hypothetical protein INS49_011979 [Diaporthe citri]
MRSSLVALVPAIGLCLSKIIEGPIDPRQHDGSQDTSESICITYVTTYLATLEPRGSTNTGLPNLPPGALPPRSFDGNEPPPQYTQPPPQPYGPQQPRTNPYGPQQPPTNPYGPPTNPYGPQPPFNPYGPQPPPNPYDPQLPPNPYGPQPPPNGYGPQPPPPPPGYGGPPVPPPYSPPPPIPGTTGPVIPPSGGVSASSPPEGSPSPAPAPDIYIVNVEALVPQVVPQPAPGKRRDIDPRAVDPTLTTNLGFISNTNVTFTCSRAAPYYTFNGQLFEVATGLALSVNFGVPFINFTIAAQGSISTRFEIVDGILRWFNPQFYNGEATFCVVGSAIFATFASFGRPADCVTVQLLLFRAAIHCLDTHELDFASGHHPKRGLHKSRVSGVVTSCRFFSACLTEVNRDTYSSIATGWFYRWTYGWVIQSPSIGTEPTSGRFNNWCASVPDLRLATTAPSPPGESSTGGLPSISPPVVPSGPGSTSGEPIPEPTTPSAGFPTASPSLPPLSPPAGESGTSPASQPVIPTSNVLPPSESGSRASGLPSATPSPSGSGANPVQTVIAGQAFNINLVQYLNNAVDQVKGITTSPDTAFLNNLNQALNVLAGTVPVKATAETITVTLSVAGLLGDTYTKTFDVVVLEVERVFAGQRFDIFLTQYMQFAQDTILGVSTLPNTAFLNALDTLDKTISGTVPASAVGDAITVTFTAVGQTGEYVRSFLVLVLESLTIIPGQPFNVDLKDFLDDPADSITNFETSPLIGFLEDGFDATGRAITGTVPISAIPETITATLTVTGQVGDYTRLVSIVVAPLQRVFPGQPFTITLGGYLDGPSDTIRGISTDPAASFLDSALNAANQQIVGTVPLSTAAGLVEVAMSAVGPNGLYTKLLYVLVVPSNIITIGQSFVITLTQYLVNPADTINGLVSIPALLTFLQDDLDIAQRQIAGVVPTTAIEGSFAISLSVTGQLSIPYIQIFYVIVVPGSSSSSSILSTSRLSSGISSGFTSTSLSGFSSTVSQTSGSLSTSAGSNSISTTPFPSSEASSQSSGAQSTTQFSTPLLSTALSSESLESQSTSEPGPSSSEQSVSSSGSSFTAESPTPTSLSISGATSISTPPSLSTEAEQSTSSPGESSTEASQTVVSSTPFDSSVESSQATTSPSPTESGFSSLSSETGLSTGSQALSSQSPGDLSTGTSSFVSTIETSQGSISTQVTSPSGPTPGPSSTEVSTSNDASTGTSLSTEAQSSSQSQPTGISTSLPSSEAESTLPSSGTSLFSTEPTSSQPDSSTLSTESGSITATSGEPTSFESSETSAGTSTESQSPIETSTGESGASSSFTGSQPTSLESATETSARISGTSSNEETSSTPTGSGFSTSALETSSLSSQESTESSLSTSEPFSTPTSGLDVTSSTVGESSTEASNTIVGSTSFSSTSQESGVPSTSFSTGESSTISTELITSEPSITPPSSLSSEELSTASTELASSQSSGAESSSSSGLESTTTEASTSELSSLVSSASSEEQTSSGSSESGSLNPSSSLESSLESSSMEQVVSTSTSDLLTTSSPPGTSETQSSSPGATSSIPASSEASSLTSASDQESSSSSFSSTASKTELSSSSEPTTSASSEASESTSIESSSTEPSSGGPSSTGPISSKSTSSEPTSTEPSSSEQTSGASTSEESTVGQSSTESTSSGGSTTESSSIAPSTTGESTLGSSSSGESTTEQFSTESSSSQATSTEASSTEPSSSFSSLEPTSTEQTSTESTQLESTSTEQISSESTSGQTSSEPTSSGFTSSESTSFEPTSTASSGSESTFPSQTSTESTSVESTSTEATSSESSSAGQTSSEPTITSSEQSSTEPPSSESTSIEPTSTEATSSGSTSPTSSATSTSGEDDDGDDESSTAALPTFTPICNGVSMPMQLRQPLVAAVRFGLLPAADPQHRYEHRSHVQGYIVVVYAASQCTIELFAFGSGSSFGVVRGSHVCPFPEPTVHEYHLASNWTKLLHCLSDWYEHSWPWIFVVLFPRHSVQYLVYWVEIRVDSVVYRHIEPPVKHSGFKPPAIFAVYGTIDKNLEPDVDKFILAAISAVHGFCIPDIELDVSKSIVPVIFAAYANPDTNVKLNANELIISASFIRHGNPNTDIQLDVNEPPEFSTVSKYPIHDPRFSAQLLIHCGLISGRQQFLRRPQFSVRVYTLYEFWPHILFDIGTDVYIGEYIHCCHIHYSPGWYKPQYFDSPEPGSTLYRVNITTGSYVTVKASMGDGTSINAMGYNIGDNFLYAAATAKIPNSLLRISASGDVVNMGSLGTSYVVNSGDVDEYSQYWASAGGKDWVQVDLKPSSSTYGKTVAKGTAAPAYTIVDWAYVPRGGNYLWTLGFDSLTRTALGGSNTYLLKFDRAAKSWTTVAKFGDIAGSGDTQRNAWGAVYASDDGYFKDIKWASS